MGHRIVELRTGTPVDRQVGLGCGPFPMTTVAYAIDIPTSPDTVFQVLTETTQHDEWNPSVTELSGRLAAGQRLKVTIRLAAGQRLAAPSRSSSSPVLVGHRDPCGGSSVMAISHSRLDPAAVDGAPLRPPRWARREHVCVGTLRR